jgi:hypothetical protein
MRKTVNIPGFFLWLAMWLIGSSFTPGVSSPCNSPDCLFKISRSRDANEIWYALNFKSDGSLNNDSPVRAFWVKKTDGNRTEPLTWVQNRYAYDVELLGNTENKPNSIQFRFVSYTKHSFEFRQSGENRYKVFTKSNNKEIEVTRIFVQIDGGSFWGPSVPFVKLIGKESQTGMNLQK